jgi:hypothetical protein
MGKIRTFLRISGGEGSGGRAKLRGRIGPPRGEGIELEI